MATSGQTLNDRINAARYALAGQGLARCVCKATTEEVIGPKKKHLDYIIGCTHEPNVSIPQLANLLIERTNHMYWVVVFKALVTVHHLMCYGNERFIQFLSTSNYSFELSTFLDKTTTRDFSMSNFIRRYSRYINEKALSYRSLGFDLCKVKRGNDGVLRTMPIDRLLKTLPVLQNQLDALLEFDCVANDLNNGVINACFMLLFRDLIGLFACHNDGIINLLMRYFNLNRKMCREAFDLYKKFLVRIDKVSEFLRVAEAVGIDKDEIPDLKRAPSSLLEALEQHLQHLESNKKILKHQGSKYSNEPGSFGSSISNSSNLKSNISSEEFSEEVRKALEEEARVLSQYGTGTKVKTTDDSIYVPETGLLQPKTIDDIFGDADSFGSYNNGSSQSGSNGSASEPLYTIINSSGTTKSRNDSIKSAIKTATNTLEGTSSNKKASDDLLGLLEAPTTASTNITNVTTTIPKIPPPIASISNASHFEVIKKQEPINPSNCQLFKPGNPFPETCGPFPPMSIAPQTAPNYTNPIDSIYDFGDVLQPISSGLKSTNGSNRGEKSTALFTGDLDSTLANLAKNFNIEGMSKKK